MRRIIGALLGIAVLILALGTTSGTTVFAKENGNKSERLTVVLDRQENEVGKSVLKGHRRVRVLIVRTKALAPGHVFSIWGINDDRPSFNIYGFISGARGTAAIERVVKLDNHLHVQQFRFVIKDHGVPLPGQGEIELQKTTRAYGCEGSCPSVQFASFVGLSDN